MQILFGVIKGRDKNPRLKVHLEVDYPEFRLGLLLTSLQQSMRGCGFLHRRHYSAHFEKLVQRYV